MGEFSALLQLLALEYDRVANENASLRAKAVHLPSVSGQTDPEEPATRTSTRGAFRAASTMTSSNAMGRQYTSVQSRCSTGVFSLVGPESGVRSAPAVTGARDRGVAATSFEDLVAMQSPSGAQALNMVADIGNGTPQSDVTTADDEGLWDQHRVGDDATALVLNVNGSLSNYRSTSARSSEPELYDIWMFQEQDIFADPPRVQHMSASSTGLETQDVSGMASLRRVQSHTLRAGDVMGSTTCLQQFIMRPSSRKRTCWDFLGLAVILYDLCVIPLRAFPLDLETTFRTADRLTTMFWSVDIVWNFFVGFHSKSFVEMRPSMIAKRYLRSWFFIDITVVMIDWSVILFQEGSSGIGLLRVLKVGRLMRVARCLRVLRIARVSGMLRNFSKFVFITESSRIALEIFLMLAFIALVSHFVACGWFAVGTWDAKDVKDATDSWVEAAREEHLRLTGELGDVGYFYTSALHWSLTQFTPASMEVVAVNTAERVYTIMVLLFGLITFSVLVSSITASMTRLRSLHSDEVRRVKDVQRYIRENHVSLELGALIFNFVREQRKHSRRRLHEKDVEYLAQLPEIRKRELHVEVFAGTLLKHPLFGEASNFDQHWIVEICHTAFTEMHIPQDQRLFSQDDKGKYMWYLTSGLLSYYGRHTGAVCRQVLEPKTFVAEVTLWLPWRFWGRMIAQETCDILAVEVGAFHRTAKQTAIMPQLQAYARLFVNNLPAEKALAETTMQIPELRGLAEQAFGNEDRSWPLQQEDAASTVHHNLGSRLLRALSKVTESKRRRLTFDLPTSKSWSKQSGEETSHLGQHSDAVGPGGKIVLASKTQQECISSTSLMQFYEVGSDHIGPGEGRMPSLQTFESGATSDQTAAAAATTAGSHPVDCPSEDDRESTTAAERIINERLERLPSPIFINL